jgi:hypothetical protein
VSRTIAGFALVRPGEASISVSAIDRGEQVELILGCDRATAKEIAAAAMKACHDTCRRLKRNMVPAYYSIRQREVA